MSHRHHHHRSEHGMSSAHEQGSGSAHLRDNRARDDIRDVVHGNHNGVQNGYSGAHNGGHAVHSSVSGRVDEIIEYLSSLTDALRNGGVQIQAGGRALGLRLGDTITLELHASGAEGRTSRIELAMSWDAPPATPAEPPLRISSLRSTLAADAASGDAPLAPTQPETGGAEDQNANTSQGDENSGQP